MIIQNRSSDKNYMIFFYIKIIIFEYNFFRMFLFRVFFFPAAFPGRVSAVPDLFRRAVSYRTVKVINRLTGSGAP